MDTASLRFLDFLCRTCMRELAEICTEQQWQSVFDTIGGNASLCIAEMLTTVIPQVEVHLTDELPKKICRKCLEQLQCIYRFQQMCIQSQRQMLQIVARANTEINIAIADIAVEHEISKLSVQEAHLAADKEHTIEMESIQIFSAPTQACNVDPLQCDDDVKMGHSLPDVSVDIINELCSVDDSKVEYNDGETSMISTSTTKNDLMALDTAEQVNLDSSTELKGKENEGQDKCEYVRFNCNLCERFYYKLESLQKHRLEHEKKSGMRKYICDVCNKTLGSAHTLWRHKRNTHSDKKDSIRKYKCELCDKAFVLSSVLKAHVRTHTGERPFLCPECGKAFSTSSQMKQHRFRHDTVKRFECPLCPMKFSCSSDLSKHKLVHDEVKRHVCDICGDRFTKAHELKTHKMYHNGIKPYKCEYCDKRFVAGDAWRRHTRTHTGEKPYKCKYCESAFAQSGDHVKHLRLHIGDNVYRCELCPAAFRLLSEKRLHFATHKNDDEETRERNKQALLDEEAKLALKFSKKKKQRLPVEQSQQEVEPDLTTLPCDV